MLDCAVLCPVCQSRYTLETQLVVGRRTGSRYMQRYCMDCSSFFHESRYREDEARQEEDFRILEHDSGKHYKLMGELVLQLVTRRPAVSSVLEVGHGCGQFMRACADFGRSVVGVEVNPYCVQFVRDHLGLDSRLGLLSEVPDTGFDMVVAIHVFEHLHHPRDLFVEAVARLNPGGSIFISVPFVGRELWPFLWSAGQCPGDSPPDPFFDNDVHVTHFSVRGLTELGLSLGARQSEFIVARDVVDLSPGSYAGVLFDFP